MHMVGHQHVGVKLAVRLFQRFTEPVQAGEIVCFGEEVRFAVVAALHEVQRDVVEVDAGRHVGRLVENKFTLALRFPHE